ncbi:MAG: formylglycine-generating enzyme family protein [Candidatus Poribacteria bacterium]|nr:formylglycine-generating enzyme family protein [Candidatus Poribacteria bacterium]
MTKHHKDLKRSLKGILERYCIIMLVGGLALVISGCERDDITSPAETITSPSEKKTPLPEGKTAIPLPGEKPPLPKGMVLIPEGEFQIGSNDREADDDEQPVRTVYVDAFYMDETEVTNAQFKEFVLKNPRWQKNRIDGKFHNGRYLWAWDGNNYPKGRDKHPVTGVSWYAAMAYSKWVEKRLPTEAEWERAARGGLVDKTYPHGNTLTPRDANYGNNIKNTTAVGRYPANGYGLYDMAGNASEWCLDRYHSGLYLTFPQEGVARNPLAGANTIQWIVDNFTNVNVDVSRVLRGGHWFDMARLPRVADRRDSKPKSAFWVIGFRCVRSVTVTP